MKTRKRKGWRDNWREARLTAEIKGKFTHWRDGERVLAVLTDGGKYLIQKMGYKPDAELPMLNQCGGVPADCVKFL